MKSKITRVVALAAIYASFFTSGSALAQQFVVSTASPGNTYDLLVKQLSTACQNEVGKPIIAKPSSGSMENVDRLINNEVPAAIVQADVMHFRANGDDLSHIKALFALHPEEVHVLALTETRKFGGLPSIGGFGGMGGVPFETIADLRGRKVGAWGGSFITAQVIRLQAEVAFNVVEFPDEATGLKALADKSVDALISVGGSPQPWVQRLDRRFRLIPIAQADAAKLNSVYRPAKLSYGNLGQTGVTTVATDAVLAVRDYMSPSMSALLNQVRGCFRKHLVDLQETPGNHPSWGKMVLTTEPKWPTYAVTVPSAIDRNTQPVVRKH